MRLGGFRLPVERLSSTSLSTYITCPEAFRHKYLLHEEEPMTGARFIGSVAHQSLRALFEEGSDPDVEVDRAWQSIIEKEGEPEWHETDATAAYKRTRQMVKTYWPIASSVTPVAVEQRFEETILGVPIVGYIDLELPDWIREVKTAAVKQTKPKPRHLFQGRLYSLVSAKPVEWHYVTRQATPQVYTPETCPDLTKQFSPDTTVTLLKHAIERMNDDFSRYGIQETWPMDGLFGDWTCGYCAFRKKCPAWANTSPALPATG